MEEILKAAVTIIIAYFLAKLYFYSVAYLKVIEAIETHRNTFNYRWDKFDYIIHQAFRPFLFQLLHPYKWTARQYLGGYLSHLFGLD